MKTTKRLPDECWIKIHQGKDTIDKDGRTIISFFRHAGNHHEFLLCGYMLLGSIQHGWRMGVVIHEN